MTDKTDVIIVSAYGRGNGLAAELQQKGVQVNYVDVTPSLGRWSPEDWEGPFGVLSSPRLTESHRRRLDSESPMQLISRGLSVWHPEGPIELRGLLANYQLSRLGGVSDALNEITENGSLNSSLKNQWKSKSFKENWFLQFCYNYSNNCFTDNTLSLENSYCPPVLGEFYVRKMDRRAYEQGLNYLKELGVKTFEQSKVTDLSFNSRFVQNLEVEGAWSGVLNADQIVWCLTSLETEYMSEFVYSKLYEESLQPQWSWMRCRVKMSKDHLVSFPEHFIFIDDLDLTWTHENLLVFNQVDSENKYDVWIRLPYVERFHRSYIKEKVDSGLDKISKRTPSLSFEIIEMPQECTYDERDLGPTCMPVYDKEFFTQFKTKTWLNLIYDSPEQWPTLEWTGRFERQNKLEEELLEWKKSKEERKRKIESELQEDQL